MNTSVSQAEVKNKEEKMEFETMNTEIGDNFEERKAADYVKKYGMDESIERLAALSLKSPNAKELLNIVLNWKYPGEQRMQPAVDKQTAVEKKPAKPTIIRTTSITKLVLEPKQKYLNTLSQLGLSCDIKADENWQPIVPVRWNKTRAFINKKRVIVSHENLPFMRRNVFSQETMEFNMHILGVSKNKVLAEPDVDDFNARQYKKRKTNEFESSVTVDDNISRLVFDSTPGDKDVIVPKRHLAQVMDNPGVWRFVIIHNNAKNLIVKPLECIKKAEPRLFEARVYAGKFGARIYSKEVGKKLVVPERFREQIGNHLGIWKFAVISDYTDCIVAQPVCFLHSENNKEVNKKPQVETRYKWINEKRTPIEVKLGTKEILQPELPPLEVVDEHADEVLALLRANGKVVLE